MSAPATQLKRCPRCGNEYPREEFGRRGNGQWKSWCPPCHSARGTEHNRDTYTDPEARERRRTINRRAQLKRRYGITPEEYLRLSAEQNHACGTGCGVTQEPGAFDLFVDHNHETGAVRGLLCPACNTGLGQFADDVDRLVGAVNYLRRHA